MRKQGRHTAASYDMLMSETRTSKIEVDDYAITASFEPAEGMYVPQADGDLEWATRGHGQQPAFRGHRP